MRRNFGGSIALALFALTPAAAHGQHADTLSLSMQEAVALAMRVSDEGRLAAAQIASADAQLTVARASALPQLRLSGSFQHVYENARGQAVGSIFNQPNTFNVNGNLSQSLFQGGRVTAGWRAASRLERAARLSASEVREQLSLDIQRAYLEALYADRALDIRSGSLELAAQRTRQVEQFASAGRAARYDVLRARVERANLEPLVIQARSDREIAMLELKRLLNIPPEQPVVLTTILDTRAVEPLLASLDSDSLGADDRPAVRAAELIARARRDAISIARADLWPSVSAFIQMGAQAFPTATRLPPIRGELTVIPCPPGTTPGRACTQQNGGFFQDRLVGLTVSWPIFDGLRTKGAIDLARAQAALAETQLSLQREAVAMDVARGRAELARARAVFAARRENAVEADEAFKLASLRFARGLSTQLEVSDAQLALLTAQSDEARSIHDLYLASASLARARGRPLPFPPVRSVPASTTSSPDTSAPSPPGS